MPRHRVPMTTLGTDQSQFNESPFQKLHNLAIREAGMVEPLPGHEVIASPGGNNYDGRRIWAFREQGQAYELALFRSTGGPTYRLRTITESASFAPNLASDSLLGEPCGATEARERIFLAMPRGALVVENEGDDVRMVGMLPPTWLGISGKTTTDAQAVPASSRVAWRATLHRKDPDGYEITSAPSYAMYAESTASITDFTLRIGWPTSATISDTRVLQGDIVRLWRSRSVTSGTSTNDRYLLTAEIEVSNTDLTNRYVEVRDVTPDAALASAEELYTNPGIQGALQANWQLGPCGDVAVYNGHAFYVERSLPAYFEARIASRFGGLSAGAAQRTYGIGRRTIGVVDTTLGSPTVTNVSAADFAGLSVGQTVVSTSGGEIPIGAKIVSWNAGAGTVTFDTNATATGSPVTVVLTDLIDINGAELRMYNLAALTYDAWDNDLRIVFTFNDLVDGEGLTTSFALSSGAAYIDGLSFRIDMIAPEGVLADDLEITATNGANYSPAIPELDDADPAIGEIDERLNRAKWAKLDQPDHVPAVNELVIGKLEIVRMLSTQDRLFVFCTDGLYAVTGNANGWSVDRVDKDIVIASQAAADEMNGNAYVYAKDRGLLRVGADGSITGLTKGAVQKAMDAEVAAAAEQNEYEAHVVCDALHDEVGVFFQSIPGSA